METTLAAPAAHRETPRVRWHRPLSAAGFGFAALTAFALVAVLVDDRTLLGEPVWLKVLKFAFAFTAYSFTLAWLIGHMSRARRFGWWTGTVFAALSVIEVGMLVMAAVLGTYSHFNTSEDLANRVLQASFGYGIPIMFAANLAIAVAVLFQRVSDRVATAVVRWGLALSTLGMAAAFALVQHEERVVEDAYGNEVTLGGAHGIGDPDGNGMFLTGWSTTGGDLRVPHFIGLHAIQVLVLVAVVLSALAARRAWLREDAARARVVHAVGLGGLGIFATTVWQAQRGQSLIDVDPVIGACFAASAAVAIGGTLLALAKARRDAPPPAARAGSDREPAAVG